MSSLTDILTTAKNIVTSINGLALAYAIVQGRKVSNSISSATVVATGQGRLVQIAVITAGTTVGAAYDATVSTATTSQIVSIPNTVGVIVVNIPTNNGIVIAPGTGQVITVSYS
jgi:hypothetical protein